MDQQNRAASGAAYARKVVRRAGADIDQICLNSTVWRRWRPGHRYGVDRENRP